MKRLSASLVRDSGLTAEQAVAKQWDEAIEEGRRTGPASQKELARMFAALDEELGVDQEAPQPQRK